MTEVYLMSLTGAVGGIIGSVAGLGSAWMAHRASRRSLEMKALDLRLEIRKSLHTLNYGVGKLEDQLVLAFKSRTLIAAAAGTLKSGSMVNWRAQFDADRAELTDLKQALEVLAPDFAHRNARDMEALLAELDGQAHRVKALLGRYRNSVAEDDQLRERARAKVRAAQTAGTVR